MHLTYSQPIYFNIIPPSPSITCQHCVFTLHGLLPPILLFFSSSHSVSHRSWVAARQLPCDRQRENLARVVVWAAAQPLVLRACTNVITCSRMTKKCLAQNRNTWTFLERLLLLLLLLLKSIEFCARLCRLH